MAKRLPGVPIVKDSDRFRGGQFAALELNLEAQHEQGKKPLFLLDDGFQHWRLHRDRDVVLIDAQNPFGNGKLLPLGILREPLSALARASHIVITRSESAGSSPLMQEIRKFNQNAEIFSASHAVSSLSKPGGPVKVTEMLRNRKVFGFCGLGNPAAFRATIGETGAEVIGFQTFRDHHPFSQKDIDRVVSEAGSAGADSIVTTEKDLVRMERLDLPDNLFIIGIAFTAGAVFYDSVLGLGQP